MHFVNCAVNSKRVCVWDVLDVTLRCEWGNRDQRRTLEIH